MDIDGGTGNDKLFVAGTAEGKLGKAIKAVFATNKRRKHHVLTIDQTLHFPSSLQTIPTL